MCSMGVKAEQLHGIALQLPKISVRNCEYMSSKDTLGKICWGCYNRGSH